MTISKALCLAAPLTLSLAGPASADVWDLQLDNDDSSETDNQLLHGTTQTHDLGVRPGPVADQDWYLMPQKPYASYEVILDGTSGDIGASALAFDRIAADGFTVAQTQMPAMADSPGYSRALRWVNPMAPVNEFVRVSGALCGTGCGSDDVYTIRVRESTVYVPRFNNAGSQVTVLLAQNATERPINAILYFWSAGGTQLWAVEVPNVPPRGLHVLSLVPALAGQSGHITVAHDGGYGGLVVKAVALEPSTGFTFDTPGVSVPY